MMEPVRDRALARRLLSEDLHHRGMKWGAQDIISRVGDGKSQLWADDQGTLVVLSPDTDMGVFIDLMVSKIPLNAISRYREVLVKFVQFSGRSFVRCLPDSDAHARLYRMYGFKMNSDGSMTFRISED